jgi:hypothetical protein
MSKKRLRFIVILVSLVVLAYILVTKVFMGTEQQNEENLRNEKIPSSAMLSQDALLIFQNINYIHDAIVLSADYLVHANNPNGKFIYRINLNSEIRPKDKYNILRHAGTMYALAEYYLRYPDEDTRKVLEKAGGFMQKYFLGPLLEKENLLAIWSPPEITNSGNPLQAKLGGTGLGLVALISLEKISPGFTSLDDLQGLGRFIVYMQKRNGNFFSKYIPSENGRNDLWQSLYYPGEAALGMIMLYEIDPSPLWLEVSMKALTYLAQKRKGQISVPVDHWALLATDKLLSVCSADELSESRELLINHAIQICKQMLGEQLKHPFNPILDGSFTPDGKTTPTATRLEGLLAALNFLPEEEQILRNQIESSIHHGIAFLLRAQINSGEYAGAIPRAIRLISAGEPGFEKNFNERATEVRIDYVQHALNAWLLYEQKFRNSPE